MKRVFNLYFHDKFRYGVFHLKDGGDWVVARVSIKRAIKLISENRKTTYTDILIRQL